MLIEKMIIGKMSVDKMPVDKMLIAKMLIDKMYIDEKPLDEMTKTVVVFKCKIEVSNLTTKKTFLKKETESSMSFGRKTFCRHT